MLVLEKFTQRTLETGRSFAGLMELFELNFLQLQSLVMAQESGLVCFCSSVNDGLDLYGQILERHPYTTELRLTYVFETDDTRSIDPDARIRIYHDARVAEVTACNPGARVARLCGLQAPDGYALERSWLRNCFLYKWLEYLHSSGHSLTTIERFEAAGWQRLTGETTAPQSGRRLLDTPQALA